MRSPVSLINLLAMLLIFGGCAQSDAPLYSRFIDLDDGAWEQYEYCEFVTAERDSALFASPTARYDVVVAVRYDDAYPFSDLYLSLSSMPAASLPEEVRLSIRSTDGEVRGHGKKGIYTLCDTIARGVPLPPLFRLSISQAMNRPVLQGINGIGLIITSHTPAL